jgi:hypothetical protein
VNKFFDISWKCQVCFEVHLHDITHSSVLLWMWERKDRTKKNVLLLKDCSIERIVDMCNSVVWCCVCCGYVPACVTRSRRMCSLSSHWQLILWIVFSRTAAVRLNNRTFSSQYKWEEVISSKRPHEWEEKWDQKWKPVKNSNGSFLFDDEIFHRRKKFDIVRSHFLDNQTIHLLE